MGPSNIKYLWANLIVEELVRNGVLMFCTSPGSRNTPLVIAIAENPKTRTVIHLDERGASFYAVGYGKGSGHPAVVVTTSGTAVANCFPAVVEAHSSATPLIVLSADRPVELRDSGANQTIDQEKIFGGYVRWFFGLPSPRTDIPPRFVLTTIDQAVYRAMAPPAGPVHVNCPFAEPLGPESGDPPPDELLQDIRVWDNTDRPLTSYVPPAHTSDPEAADTVLNKIASSRRGIVVVGPIDGSKPTERLAEGLSDLKMPVFADVASGMRFGKFDRGPIITNYDLFLRIPRLPRSLSPDLVLHIGERPTSRALSNFIAGSDAEYIVVNDTPFRHDPYHQVSLRVEADPIDFLRSLDLEGAPDRSAYLARFQRLDRLCTRLLKGMEVTEGPLSEFMAARVLLENLPDDSGLFLANSMPVRDADGCGATSTRDVVVGVNRGASGIDGTIASAAGFAEGSKRHTALLIGDLAFVHDLNSLLLARGPGFPLTIVLINNNGGGIFSFLPISGRPEYFEEYFAAPHNLSLGEITAAFGLAYSNPCSAGELGDACRNLFDGRESGVIEVNTDRRQNVEAHRRIWDAVASAVERDLVDDIEKGGEG